MYSMDKVSTESFSSKTFDSYSDENLFKLYRAIKGKLLNPPQYKSNKQTTILFEIGKNIKDILIERQNQKIVS